MGLLFLIRYLPATYTPLLTPSHTHFGHKEKVNETFFKSKLLISRDNRFTQNLSIGKGQVKINQHSFLSNYPPFQLMFVKQEGKGWTR